MLTVNQAGSYKTLEHCTAMLYRLVGPKAGQEAQRGPI